MNSKAIPGRKKPTAGREKIDRLYLDLLRWFYEEENRERALKVAKQLESLLARRPDLATSIRGEEIRALVAELRGDLGEAIRCRESEIRKIFELHDLARDTPGWGYVLREYDYSDLSDRLELLAVLYHDEGDLARAIEILRESKRLCESHHIPFDGQALLDEYEEATPRADGRAGQPRKAPREARKRT